MTNQFFQFKWWNYDLPQRYREDLFTTSTNLNKIISRAKSYNQFIRIVQRKFISRFGCSRCTWPFWMRKKFIFPRRDKRKENENCGFNELSKLLSAPTGKGGRNKEVMERVVTTPETLIVGVDGGGGRGGRTRRHSSFQNKKMTTNKLLKFVNLKNVEYDPGPETKAKRLLNNSTFWNERRKNFADKLSLKNFTFKTTTTTTTVKLFRNKEMRNSDKEIVYRSSWILLIRKKALMRSFDERVFYTWKKQKKLTISVTPSCVYTHVPGVTRWVETGELLSLGVFWLLI